MIKIKTFNEKGYTLIFVLITTSILLLLGFTAITLSQDNFKMKSINSVSKKNFYIAEALSEEADMKLNEYLEGALDNSYENVLNYLAKTDEGDNIDIELINEKFQEFYKEEVYVVKKKLENTNNYNLKIIEKYDVFIEVDIKEDLETEGFHMYIIATFKDKNILEKIRTDYTLQLPKYDDPVHNRDLLEKVGWVNSKW